MWYGQICVPVAGAILENCYMLFVNKQKLFLSGERIVANGTLVSCLVLFVCSVIGGLYFVAVAVSILFRYCS